MQILALGYISHFLPVLPPHHPSSSLLLCGSEPGACLGSVSSEWPQWLSPSTGGRCVWHPSWASTTYGPVALGTCPWAPPLSISVWLLQSRAELLFLRTRPALLPCTPNTLAHHLHAAKILTTPSTPSYLLKALPHRNAALLYWGSVCVLFNSERQAPRIARKINVNQL